MKLQIILSFLLIFSFCSQSSGKNSDSFSLSLTITNDEQSEDSHGWKAYINLSGQSGNYSWEYTGDHPDPNFEHKKSKNFKLNDQQMEELVKLIETNQLNQFLEEIKPSEDKGAGGIFTDVLLEITKDGVKNKIHIVGMTAIWGSGKEETNIQSIKILEKIEKLENFLEKIAKGD